MNFEYECGTTHWILGGPFRNSKNSMITDVLFLAVSKSVLGTKETLEALGGTFQVDLPSTSAIVGTAYMYHLPTVS